MRVLIIHNFYREKGGEDKVFQEESALIGNSENVMTLTFRNEGGWKGAWQFLISPWNLSACRKVRRTVREFRPDVVHLHNWHFASGPAIIRTVHGEKVPIVLTLHNYRLVCPSATLLDGGRIFTESIHAGFPWKAVFKGLYRGSRFQTFWLALTVRSHRAMGTWNQVDRYIALTSFARDLFIGSTLGVPADRFVVKQNFVRCAVSTSGPRDDHFLFVGRLTEEKGILPLLKAFSGTDRRIVIAGDGPLKGQVEAAAKKHPNISYLGALSGDQVLQQMRACTALVFPSIWYEGMPMTIIEAFAAGTPVIASRTGAMASMITDGVNGSLFPIGDEVALQRTVQAWHEKSVEEKARIGAEARNTYERLYTPEVNHQLLLDIYRQVVKGDDMTGNTTS